MRVRTNAPRKRAGVNNTEGERSVPHIREGELVTHALAELRTEPVEPEHALRVRRFSDLGHLAPEPEWLWEGLLARGALTMLAGHPYVGKSMLVSGLLKAMESGAPFLGRATRSATALLVTEEHEVTLRPRAERLRLLELRSEFVGRSEGVFRVDWPRLIDEAGTHALRSGHDLLVIDTFTGLAGLGAEEENDAGAITERLHPLQAAAGEGLAVLFLHHLNKNGQPRGSSAFRGVTDTAIRMHRDRGKKQFSLTVESRFASAPSLKGTLIESDEGTSYIDVDERKGLKQPIEANGGTQDPLFDALRNAGRAGLSYEEIRAIPGLSVYRAKRRFPGWYEEQKIHREESGVKGAPYRWFALPT
jgi:hypothetical protein